jgi:hypothetical protein
MVCQVELAAFADALGAEERASVTARCLQGHTKRQKFE